MRFAKERHTICRASDLPYPQRAVRDRRFLYIRNFEPNRWPAGSPTLKSSHGWTYGDIDQSPSFNYLKNINQKLQSKSIFFLPLQKNLPRNYTISRLILNVKKIYPQ